MFLTVHIIPVIYVFTIFFTEIIYLHGSEIIQHRHRLHKYAVTEILGYLLHTHTQHFLGEAFFIYGIYLIHIQHFTTSQVNTASIAIYRPYPRIIFLCQLFAFKIPIFDTGQLFAFGDKLKAVLHAHQDFAVNFLVMLFSIPAKFQPVVIQVLRIFYESRNACIQTSDILPVQIDQTVKMCTVRNYPTICSYLQLIPIRLVTLRGSLYPSENISILHMCPLRPKTQHFFVRISAIIPHDLGIFHV